MVTFTVNNLDPHFILDKNKMIDVMNDICALLSLANGPILDSVNNNDSFSIKENGFKFKYIKEFNTINIEFWDKSMYLLKLKNLNSTSLEIVLNVKNPELEIKEINYLLKPFKCQHILPSRPTDG